MTTSHHQGKAHQTMTLVTFNHYVDNATDASKIARWYVLPGAHSAGNRGKHAGARVPLVLELIKRRGKRRAHAK